MRPDGTRVRDLTAIMQALPYVMPKRYDAQNWAEENLDEDAIRDYIRAKRREGRSVTHMSLLVSAYYRAVLKNPKINYFVMNRRIYKRNHFCFSFVILKTRADGTPDETSLKVYLEPEDTVFTVTEKIRSTIEKNQNVRHNNDTDRFAKFVFGVPGLARAVFALAGFLDRHDLLPKSIIAEPLPYQPVRDESGLYQYALHFPPLLRVWHYQRVRLHGAARPRPAGAGGRPEEDHAYERCHGRADRHRH